ncbi:uncharacterized protein LOC135222367 [Macrobrachium nipponense]|uniref:uncharacterized protein LOC135222367 n=1 Tax=Macrobrachium nipponense TaxID=159736 RepID=UPI0030C87140
MCLDDTRSSSSSKSSGFVTQQVSRQVYSTQATRVATPSFFTSGRSTPLNFSPRPSTSSLSPLVNSLLADLRPPTPGARISTPKPTAAEDPPTYDLTISPGDKEDIDPESMDGRSTPLNFSPRPSTSSLSPLVNSLLADLRPPTPGARISTPKPTAAEDPPTYDLTISPGDKEDIDPESME